LAAGLRIDRWSRFIGGFILGGRFVSVIEEEGKMMEEGLKGE